MTPVIPDQAILANSDVGISVLFRKDSPTFEEERYKHRCTKLIHPVTPISEIALQWTPPFLLALIQQNDRELHQWWWW
jgi:hypothetical protein